MANKEEKITQLEIIKEILENDVATRDDDMLLYEKVMKHYNISSHFISFHSLKKLIARGDLPPFTSVMRLRRKVQEEFPHLHSSEKIAKRRRQNISEFIEISKIEASELK